MLHFETVSSATLELLKRIQTIEQMADLRLVGGTALALQSGHRISIDLDLFAYNTKQDILSILAALKAEGLRIEIRRQSSNMLISMIEQVKVDIVIYPYPWIDDAIRTSGAVLAGKKDISAMKLDAITNRGTRKDFVDLYFLLKEFTLNEMIGFYKQKYTDASIFMLLKSLHYFDDAELEEMPNMLDTSTDWEQMKLSIENEVSKQLGME